MNLGGLFEGPHLLILLALLFVFFGAKRLPELGKGIGEGLKGFKEGIKGVTDPAPPVQAQSVTTPPPAAAPADQKQNPVA
jgi:sec-independent protein translocase protein TatA